MVNPEESNLMMELVCIRLEWHGEGLVKVFMCGIPEDRHATDEFAFTVPSNWAPKLGTKYTVTVREGALPL